MDRPVVDRRVDERFGQPAISGTQAILRPGHAVVLIDLSAGGALIEGPRPMRPGTRVHVQLVSGTRRFALNAHVLRCSVSALDPEAGVRYRGALRFDERCEAIWEAGTLDGYLFPNDVRTARHSAGQALPSPFVANTHRSKSDAD
jgi:PilZ domain